MLLDNLPDRRLPPASARTGRVEVGLGETKLLGPRDPYVSMSRYREKGSIAEGNVGLGGELL